MNACLAPSFMLLAQMERFDGLRERFSGPRARFGLDDALTAIGALLAVAIVLYFINRWHNRHSGRHSYNNSKALFHELCKVHNLDRKTRQLLQRVARWQRLAHPARLFLEPERFEPVNLSPEFERHAAELLELRARLFTFEVPAEAPTAVQRTGSSATRPVGATTDQMVVSRHSVEGAPDGDPSGAEVKSFAATALASTSAETTPGSLSPEPLHDPK